MESLLSLGSRLKGLSPQLSEQKTKFDMLRGKLESLNESKDRLEMQLSSIQEGVLNLKHIEEYLSRFADERQAAIHKQIEATVTEGLQTVFQEDMRLEIRTKVVGSRAEVEFIVVSQTSEGQLETGIMDARGGGVAAIVGFLIQAVLVLLTPNMRPIMFLDETFRNVSEEYLAP